MKTLIARMSRSFAGIAVIVMLVAGATAAWATPARPVARIFTQPDGTTFSAILKGDESFNWYETDGGYAVIIDGNSGWWHYIEDTISELPGRGRKLGLLKHFREGKFKRHHFRVGKHNPNGNRHLLRDIGSIISTGPSATDDMMPRTTPSVVGYDDIPNAPASRRITFGTVKFGDTPVTYSMEQMRQRFLGATDSLKAYVGEITGGKTALLPHPEIAGTANDGNMEIMSTTSIFATRFNPEMLPEVERIFYYQNFLFALYAKYMNTMDYSEWDTDGNGTIDPDENVTFLFLPVKDCSYEGRMSTVADPCIWPQVLTMTDPRFKLNDTNLGTFAIMPAYTGEETFALGPIAHEAGHLLFGWPDLYDSDGTSDGLGNFDIMATGAWCAAAGQHPGTMPVHPSAYLKAASGIIEPTTLIDGDWFNELPAAAENGGAYRIDTGAPNEFFLIENRASVGFDRGLESCISQPTNAGGLLVLHADTDVLGMNDETRKQVDVEEADAVQHLDAVGNGRGSRADLFASDISASTFSDTTSPSARTYDGAATGILVHGITASSTLMRFHVGDTAMVPAASTSPASLAFGSVVQGFAETRELTVENTGNKQLVIENVVVSGAPFSVDTAGTSVIEAGQTSTWIVTFAPGAVSSYTGTLTITTNDPFSPTTVVGLTGIGTERLPDITLTPESIAFGVVEAGLTSAPQYISVDNAGTAPLSLLDVSLAGADADAFVVQDSCDLIDAGDTCTLAVTFAPTHQGPAEAVLSISTNDPDEAVISVPLTGTGIVYEPSLSISTAIIDFGLNDTGTETVRDIMFTNPGTAPLVIESAVIDGFNPEAFAVESACETIEPGETCTASVIFAPVAGGPVQATLSVTSNDPASETRTVTLIGEGKAPEADISVTPVLIEFGSVKVNRMSDERIITVSNDGDAPLTVEDLSITGTGASVFIIVNNCDTVEPGGSCTITARFAPLAVESSETVLAIHANDPDEAVSHVTLRGTGVRKVSDDGASPDGSLEDGTGGNGNGNGTGETGAAGGGCSAGDAPLTGSFLLMFLALGLRIVVRRRG